MSKTALHDTDRFKAALARAAAKAGVSLEGLQTSGVCTDRTWGDRCGVVFYGASPAVNERAARFFLAYASKHAGTGSYEAQRSLSYHGVMHYVRYSNGAQGWHSGPLEPASRFGSKRVEGYEGVAVNTTYYPCAD